MQTLQKPVSNKQPETMGIERLGGNKLLTGIAIAAGSTYVPFALTFSLTRAAHVTSSTFPGSGSIVAVTGLVSTLLAMVAVYECRNSLKSLVLITAAVFAQMAILVSLIV